MRKFLLIIFLLPLFAIAQPVPTDGNGKVTFVKPVAVDTMLNKNLLYSNAKSWIAANYRSPKDVILLDDKDVGIIKLRAYSDLYIKYIMTLQEKMWYTLTIYMKDGRYKYEITDIVYESGSNGNAIGSTKYAEQVIKEENIIKETGERHKGRDEYKRETLIKINELVSSLYKTMSKVPETLKNDW